MEAWKPKTTVPDCINSGTFGRFLRLSLTSCATPLHRLPGLSRALGIDLWIKRDDLTEFGGGGNKVRKLEFLMAEALKQDADTIVTAGSPQSNHARLTAAAAARLGLGCEILASAPPGQFPDIYFRNGNRLLFDAFGAFVRPLPTGSDSLTALQTRAREIRKDGRRPFVIPVGGSTAIGCLGFLNASFEIAEQAQAQKIGFDVTVLASGSGGMHAGLLVGNALAPFTRYLVGASVGREKTNQIALVDGLAGDCAALTGLSGTNVSADVFDGARGPGYGLLDDGTRTSLLTAARRDGLLLDPVYTGKAFNALKMMLERGKIASGSKVLFWHSGGTPALFAYPDAVDSGEKHDF